MFIFLYFDIFVKYYRRIYSKYENKCKIYKNNEVYLLSYERVKFALNKARWRQSNGTRYDRDKTSCSR